MDIKTKIYAIKIFDNDLVAIRKSKVTFTLNKPAYVRMCIFKNKCCNNSRLLFTGIDSLMYEIETEGVYEDFIRMKMFMKVLIRMKMCLILVIIQLS